jgi:hypothetical protein
MLVAREVSGGDDAVGQHRSEHHPSAAATAGEREHLRVVAEDLNTFLRSQKNGSLKPALAGRFYAKYVGIVGLTHISLYCGASSSTMFHRILLILWLLV